MKNSVWTAGKIYEEVFRMRKDIDELNMAVSLVDDEIGRTNAAYRLLQTQKDEKFKELQAFERQVFTQPQPTSFMSDSEKLFEKVDE